ncbi:hypothetical protein NEHOM01_2460 [Nematocida homosporus]|uniref:uncharacterized protein n=1 Tax=Nematocida homosporus TaxID=1912981 RepID=UPI00221E8BF6|nr:uncharacterized protein NEHOM01_2460 [Nematocida homosporus]KAI5187943.1 hypothetical protein NEHOM01_2460 [Nematocida homosporus]
MVKEAVGVSCGGPRREGWGEGVSFGYYLGRQEYLVKLANLGVSSDWIQRVVEFMERYHLGYFLGMKETVLVSGELAAGFRAYHTRTYLSGFKTEEEDQVDNLAATEQKNGQDGVEVKEEVRMDGGVESASQRMRSKITDARFDRQFVRAYGLYVNGQYLGCREVVEELLRWGVRKSSIYFGCRLHLLSLGGAAAYRAGQYYDALWLSRAGIKLASLVGFPGGVKYFDEMVGIIEYAAGVQLEKVEGKWTLLAETIEEPVERKLSIEDKIGRALKYGNELSLLRDVKIYDPRERMFVNEPREVSAYVNEIRHIGDVCTDVSPLLVYTIDGAVAFGLIFTQNSKTKMSVIKTKIMTAGLLARMKEIGRKNREVLKRACLETTDKKKWWEDRESLDKAIEREVVQLDTYLRRFQQKGHAFANRVILVIEDVLGIFPFEMCSVLMNCGITRASSLGHIMKARKKPHEVLAETDFFYVLNPEQNLPQTEERVLSFLASHLPQATGIKNRIPEPMEAEKAMVKHRVFMYFGHGGGEKFFSPKSLGQLTKDIRDKRTTLFLFGCSSARVFAFPKYNTHSTCISYLHNPAIEAVVGSLWDITDKDLDLVSLKLIAEIKTNPNSLPWVLNRAKHECRLKYLNGAALVLYSTNL